MNEKMKYHKGKGRCVGKHCLHCAMLGREESLYGDKIEPFPKEEGGE